MKGCVDCRHLNWKSPIKCTNPSFGGNADFYDEKDNPLSLCGPNGLLWEKELNFLQRNEMALFIIILFVFFVILVWADVI